MESRCQTNDADLEYVDQGDGEPVLFIHGALLADAFAPLLSQQMANPARMADVLAAFLARHPVLTPA